MHERRVTGRTPECLVDPRELVDADHQKRERMAVALVDLDVAPKFVFQIPTVVKSSERVRVCDELA